MPSKYGFGNTRKKSPTEMKSSGFKMKSPLKHPTHEDHHNKSKKGGTHPSTRPGYYKGQDVKVNL